MPDFKPNPVVRVVAVLALMAAFVLVVAVVVSTNGSDSGSGGDKQAKTDGPTKRGQRAVDDGVWIVRPGDTLGAISQQTGIDIDVLVQLNPDLDPQTLLEGQRISLR